LKLAKNKYNKTSLKKLIRKLYKKKYGCKSYVGFGQGYKHLDHRIDRSNCLSKFNKNSGDYYIFHICRNSYWGKYGNSDDSDNEDKCISDNLFNNFMICDDCVTKCEICDGHFCSKCSKTFDKDYGDNYRCDNCLKTNPYELCSNTNCDKKVIASYLICTSCKFPICKECKLDKKCTYCLDELCDKCYKKLDGYSHVYCKKCMNNDYPKISCKQCNKIVLTYKSNNTQYNVQCFDCKTYD